MAKEATLHVRMDSETKERVGAERIPSVSFGS